MTSSATRSPSGRQRDALVADVAHQPALVELLDHRRHRGGRHAEPLGQRVGGHGAVALARQRVDRLGVVLDRLRRTRAFRGRHQAATSRPVANISPMPPRMPVTAAGCSVRPSSSRSDGHQRDDHLDDRAGAEAEQERGQRGVVGGRADPRAEHRGRARDQPQRDQPAERGARLRERRDDRQPLGRVVQREADDEERAQRQRARRVGGADRHALAEVVQPDADRDQRRATPRRRAGPATRRRRSAAGRRRSPRRTRAPRRRTPASPRPPARGLPASRRRPGTPAGRRSAPSARAATPAGRAAATAATACPSATGITPT